jgi:ADP-ribose pyrophosphatase YjhB (NUDIX family)
MINKEQLLKNIKERQSKFGKNFPWKAWLPADVEPIYPANDDAPILNYKCHGQPKTVFSGRFCAVSGFIYAIVDGQYCILANLRGPGTPDYQGCWNAPCGFLECFENSKEGIQRELFEECGFIVDTDDLNVIYVETEPEECNNGNVSIRHYAFLGKIIPHYDKKEGGEENEVDSVKWIPVKDIDKYKCAFNHIKTTKLYAPVWWKRIIIELYYKWFKNYNDKYTDVLQEIQAELKK